MYIPLVACAAFEQMEKAKAKAAPKPALSYQPEHGRPSPFGNGQCFTSSIQGEGMGIDHGEGLGIGGGSGD